jgi:hypothetical protein
MNRLSPEQLDAAAESLSQALRAETVGRGETVRRGGLRAETAPTFDPSRMRNVRAEADDAVLARAGTVGATLRQQIAQAEAAERARLAAEAEAERRRRAAAAAARGGAGATTDTTTAAMEAAHRAAQQLRGTGISAPTMGTMFERAAEDQAAARAREATERQAAIGRQSNAITDALAAQERAGQALTDAQAGQFRAGGVQGNDERLAMLREQAAATQAMLTQTDAAIAAARERVAAETELNGLLSQRAGLVAANSAAEREAAALERERIAGLTSYRDAMVTNLGGVAEAFGAATEAAINGQEAFGTALRNQLRAVLVALAKQSVVEGLKNLALGFSALATPGTQLSAAGYFKAAGLWAATGVAAGAGAAAIPQASAPAAGAGAARAPTAARAREGGAGGETQQPLTLNIVVNGALFNEGVEEGVVRARARAATRGLSPRVLRMGRGMA